MLHLKNQLIKYIIVGAINTIAGYSIILFLINIGLLAELSNFLGYAVVWILSYELNKQFTFKFSDQSKKVFLKYISTMLIVYCVNLTILIILFRFLDFNIYLAQLIASIAYTLIGYSISKKWVFSHHNKGKRNVNFFK